jgi:23S rRNA pseudouridine2605 synthase
LSGIRLNKLLATRGIGARRKCDTLIESGAVQVNGVTVSEPGMRVEPEIDRVMVNGRPLPGAPTHRYLMLNKPVGMITTMDDPEGRRTIRDLLPSGSRLYPVGRLDADTSGLLIVTNDGELAHHLMHPRYGVEKHYRVLLEREPTERQLERLATGVEIEPGVVSGPARVRRRDPVARGAVIEITLHEGRYRQVRRMCEALGLAVLGLHRWAYGPLRLGELARGVWRELSESEVEMLRGASARPTRRGAPSRGFAPPRAHTRGVRRRHDEASPTSPPTPPRPTPPRAPREQGPRAQAPRPRDRAERGTAEGGWVGRKFETPRAFERPERARGSRPTPDVPHGPPGKRLRVRDSEFGTPRRAPSEAPRPRSERPERRPPRFGPQSRDTSPPQRRSREEGMRQRESARPRDEWSGPPSDFERERPAREGGRERGRPGAPARADRAAAPDFGGRRDSRPTTGRAPRDAARGVERGTRGAPPARFERGSRGAPPARFERGSRGAPPARFERGSRGAPAARAPRSRPNAPPARLERWSRGGPPARLERGGRGAPPARFERGGRGAPPARFERGGRGAPPARFERGTRGAARFERGSRGAPPVRAERGTRGAARFDRGGRGAPPARFERAGRGAPPPRFERSSRGAPPARFERSSRGAPPARFERSSRGAPPARFERGGGRAPSSGFDRGRPASGRGRGPAPRRGREFGGAAPFAGGDSARTTGGRAPTARRGRRQGPGSGGPRPRGGPPKPRIQRPGKRTPRG